MFTRMFKFNARLLTVIRLDKTCQCRVSTWRLCCRDKGKQTEHCETAIVDFMADDDDDDDDDNDDDDDDGDGDDDDDDD
eukprot:9400588-Karenia_brevis.AAC.1